MKIITRKEAKVAGQKTYFTGKACKFDHVSPRRTANCECIACEKVRKAKTVKKVVEVKKMIRKVIFSAISSRPGHPHIISDVMVAA